MPGMINFLYRRAAKPFFFAQDPEDVHDRMTAMGEFLGAWGAGRLAVRTLFNFTHPSLAQDICGIHFKNPVGLAAGFDKDGRLTRILPEVGFGYEEIGSVTGEPCPGNPRPRLWRLKESRSLLVYYGLKNDGCTAIARRLAERLPAAFPLGISIAKTNSPETVSEPEGIADYVKAYAEFVRAGIGDFYTINISCPNAFGGEPFSDPEKLNRLLAALRAAGGSRPVFLKMPPEIPLETVDRIIELARTYKIAGFVSTNLAKDRSNDKLLERGLPPVGGMSGKVVQELSDRQIAHIYEKTHGEFVIIGCGGIFSAEDAYRKIKLGASLVQLITGMIYEGPGLIGDINRGLIELLARDGYKNISEAVGIEFKNKYN